jgi:hypothetical protein
VDVGRFELFASVFVVLRGPGGEPLLRTTELDGELACRAAIHGIRLNAAVRERYERRCAAHGGRYFVLKNAWGDALGFSPIFDSELGCERAITSTMACAAHALVVRATPITRELDARPAEDPIPIDRRISRGSRS